MKQRHLFTADDELLRRFAAENVLLAFDYDGTLSPIVRRPEDARMRGATRRLLAEAARLYPCAIISGRAQADLRRHLGSVPVWELVGNHGLEPSDSASRFAEQVQRWVPQLRARLESVEGVVVEDKGLSVSLHYRNAPRKLRALRQIIDAVERIGPARLLGGKMVINVLPEGGPNKGVALERVRQKLGCSAAIYVGDDTTDEDVFSLASPTLLAVRIGARHGSKAPYFLDAQDEIDTLLERLIDLRRPSAPQRRRLG